MEYKQQGRQVSAILQKTLDLLEQTRARQTSLRDGQTITIGGGSDTVRNSLPFYSMKAKDVNRIGWAEDLFTEEDKMLLNDRFVDILVRKDLGDAVRLKGGTYLLDVNNKMVIIGGTFNNPVIHYVMLINADNATYAQEIKEVIFTHEHLKSLTAREASRRLEIYETYFGQEVVRIYDGQDFGYSSQSTDLYARLPEGFASYGYTQQQQDGSGVSAEAEETGTAKRLRFSKGTATVEAEEAEQTEQRTPPSADARLMGEHTARMDEVARNSGKLPRGERISRDIAVPRKVGGKKTMRWVRTFFESDVGEPDMVDPVAEEVLAQGMAYRVVSDQRALDRAESFIGKNGYEQALQDFYFNADRMEDGVKFNFARGKETVAQGQLLLRAAAERKDYHNFKKLVVLLAEIETLAGQTVQAASMLKKMGGEAKMFEVKRVVDKLNRKLAEGKYGEKGKVISITMEETDTDGDKIVISPQLLDRLIAAGNDGDAANEAVVNIYKDIAKQLPASFLDKWNTWRYLAMLFNPTTHFRNLLSNAAFVVPMEIKNSLQWAIECGAGAFKSDMERTTTLGWNAAAMEFGREDARKMELTLKGGGKYNEQDTIDQYRDRFKSRWLNWIDKGSRLNSGLLELEDWLFLKNHYATAMARYITANKLEVGSITPEQLEAARQYAVAYAKKATFRDASKMANALSSVSDKSPWANLLVESVMPFKKTPINILKRGVEYSPLGLLSTLSYGSVQLKNGKITTGEYISGLAAGLTGTGILALGFFLAKIGWLQGGFGRDDDDKENRAKDKLLRLEGVQEYSLTIGGVSYTLDWMAPTAIPLFMGVELYDALSDQNPNVWDKVWDAIIDGTDVIIETSMLNGLRGFIDGIKYDDNALIGIASNSAVNYASQAFPTVAGKITATIDDKRRINYVDKNSWVPEVLQEVGNKFFTKFWPWAKPVYYDEFGREHKTGNVFGRALQNFFSPGYYSKVESGQVEEMLMEIYGAMEEPSPIPSTAAKYFKVDGENKYLSAKEYEAFSEKRGKMAYDIMHQAVASPDFETLDATRQAAVLKEAYAYANAIAKAEVADCELSSVTGEEWIGDAQSAEKALGLANILIYRQIANTDVTKEKRFNAIPLLRDAGLSEREAFTYAGSIRRSYRSGIEGTVYTTADIYQSITTGGNMYTEIYQDILSAYMRGGKSRKDANTAIKRGLSAYFKSDYLEATGNRRAEIRRQMIICGAYGTAEDVRKTIENWEDE